MENAQTLLTIVVIALTVLLIVIGVQIFLMLMDARRALKRLNSLLDDVALGRAVLDPEKVAGFIEKVRAKLRFLKN